MMVSPSTMRVLDDIAQREQELRDAFTPGATAQHGDAAGPPAVEPDLGPLSVAPPTDAYFIARDERGRQMFSQDGVFHVHDDTLVDRNGQPVLGYQGGDGRLAPIRVDPVDAALGRTSDLRIEQDGQVCYERTSIDPKNGETDRLRVVAGRIALARFSAATRLQPIDGTRSVAPPGVGPHIGAPADGNFAPLATHMHERSRIDVLAGIDRLQDAYMAFDALRAAHGAQGRVEKIAMDLLK